MPAKKPLPQTTLGALHHSTWYRRSDECEVVVSLFDPSAEKLQQAARGSDRLRLTTANRSRSWPTSYENLVRNYRDADEMLAAELAEVIDQ